MIRSQDERAQLMLKKPTNVGKTGNCGENRQLRGKQTTAGKTGNCGENRQLRGKPATTRKFDKSEAVYFKVTVDVISCLK
jgi:hypothetical protein